MIVFINKMSTLATEIKRKIHQVLDSLDEIQLMKEYTRLHSTHQKLIKKLQNDQMHKCDCCEKTFNNKYNCERHKASSLHIVIQSIHDGTSNDYTLNDENQYECLICNTEVSKHRLVKHLDTVNHQQSLQKHIIREGSFKAAGECQHTACCGKPDKNKYFKLIDELMRFDVINKSDKNTYQFNQDFFGSRCIKNPFSRFKYDYKQLKQIINDESRLVHNILHVMHCEIIEQFEWLIDEALQ